MRYGNEVANWLIEWLLFSRGFMTQGFYRVYGGVFQRIADEEEQYMDEDEESLPPFGKPL